MEADGIGHASGRLTVKILAGKAGCFSLMAAAKNATACGVIIRYQ